MNNKYVFTVDLLHLRIKLDRRNLPESLFVRMRGGESIRMKEWYQDMLDQDLAKIKNDQKVRNETPSLCRRAYKYFLTIKTIRQIQKLFSRL